MRGFLIVSFLFLHILQNCAKNATREDKFLSVFTVVKFPNDPCGSSTGLNGTCYTNSQCESLGGSSSGSCASSFGVCCVFSLTCGQSSSQNNTYATMTSFTVSSDPSPCVYTICKSGSDVCKLRIDFESMTIASPYIFPDPATAAADFTSSTAQGDCTTDTFSISVPGGSRPPIICGENSGQHMFVPVSDQCNDISFNIDTGSTSTTRTWQLKMTQYECNSPMAPEQDCLQWHTASTGTFYSFNWKTTEAATNNQDHLSDQYYDICIRRSNMHCQICYSPYIASNAAIHTTTFGLGTSSDDTIAKAMATDAKCLGTMTLDGAIETNQNSKGADYLTILGANNAPSACAAVGAATKVCGVYFTVTVDHIEHNTICSCSIPFKVGVHFDANEAVSGILTANKKTNNENNVPTAGSGYGLSGFYLQYWQVSC